jgi:hypothetical protein
MKNIKLHASPHLTESATACPKVWDAEGDSRDLAGRRSSNLRRPAERRRHPAAGRCRPAEPPAAGRRRPAASSAVLLLPLPPPEPTAHHLCPTTCN